MHLKTMCILLLLDKIYTYASVNVCVSDDFPSSPVARPEKY